MEVFLKQLLLGALGMLTPEQLRQVADKALDYIENHVEESENKWDDLLLPVIQKLIREPFGIEDNDPVEAGS